MRFTNSSQFENARRQEGLRRSEDIWDLSTLTEWGYFYRNLMPVVWEEQGYYENEKDLDFWRLNNISQHDPEKFYYVWAVEKAVSSES